MIRMAAFFISQIDGLTQADVTKMMDHINSYMRKKLNNSIILKPALLRK